MSNCCPEFYPIKVSQLARYQNIDLNDFLLVIESGSANYSRRSTIADLVNAFRLFPSGSYSGSFSGSFKGKVISKNANLTGALSGSYQGSIISKNSIASGSFSGSHYGKFVSKNTKATGSFKGTFYGDLYGYASGSLLGSLISKNTKASGSFSGSLYGKLLSKNTIASGSFSGSHYGKIISKNTKASGSFSGSFYGKISDAFEADTLLQSSNQPYKFTYFDGTSLVNSPNFSYDPIYQNYYISSSNYSNYLIVDSKATGTFAQSGLILSNNYNRKNRVPSYTWGPEGWRLFANASGSLDLASLTGSYQFTNANFTAKGINPYFSAIRTVNNVFYFWPEPNSYQTITRDASLAIGLNAPDFSLSTPRTKARLHISVFSSSAANRGTGAWSGTGTVRQLDGAIYVEYGSGSLASPIQRTFFVSGSGNMYSAGTFTIVRGITGSLSGSTFGRIISKNTIASGSFSGSLYGNLRSKTSFITGSFKGIDNITNFKGTGKKVSVNATASYAITSSFALSVASSAASVNRKTIEVQAYGYPTAIPTIVAHGCPITTPPYGFIANWVAKSGNPLASAGSIFNFNDVWYRSINDDVDQYTAGAAIKVDSTNVSIGWPYNWNFNNTPGGAILIPDASPTQFKTFTASDWNLRITLFY